jgi:TPR repeat protein
MSCVVDASVRRMVVACWLSACAPERPPIVPTMAPVKNASVCWRQEDYDPQLMPLLGTRLTSAGYSLVDSGCDLKVGVKPQGAEVALTVRGSNGMTLDELRVQREADPDRLAVVIVNALNGSRKVLEYVDPMNGLVATPADSGPLAATRWRFCDSTATLDLYANGTLMTSNASCAISRWTQDGDRLQFDCNANTAYDLRVRANRLLGTSSPAHQKACFERVGPSVPTEDLAVLQSLLALAAPRARACTAASNQPSLAGCFYASVTVSSNGKVDAVEDRAAPSSAIADVAVRQCIIAELSKPQFPEVDGTVSLALPLGLGSFRGVCQSASQLELESAQAARKAHEQHEKECERGGAEGCNSSAIDYQEGRGVAVDEARAVTLYEKSCDELKLAAACSNLGSMYDDGKGVAQDKTKASALYERSCKGGSLRGCNLLGIHYLYGYGGRTKSYPQAVSHFKGACDGGNVYGCSNMGYMLRHGYGVPVDLAKSLALYRKGCEGGDANGCAGLGYVYDVGLGVPKNPTVAATYYRKGCDGADEVACMNLGLLYEAGNGVTQDLRAAAQLYEKACNKGSYQSCDYLGSLYHDGRGVSQDDAAARVHFEQACDHQITAACTHLGALPP